MNIQLMETDRSQEVRDRFAATPFSTPESFISALNMGYLSSRADDIRELAEDISQGFRNVEYKSNRLNILSPSAVAYNDIMKGLERWDVIVTLKKALVNENYSEEFVYFHSEDDPGYALRYAGEEVIDEEEGKTRYVFERISNEKIARDTQEVVDSIPGFQKVGDSGVYRVATENVHGIDDSFLLDMANLLR